MWIKIIILLQKESNPVVHDIIRQLSAKQGDIAKWWQLSVLYFNTLQVSQVHLSLWHLGASWHSIHSLDRSKDLKGPSINDVWPFWAIIHLFTLSYAVWPLTSHLLIYFLTNLPRGRSLTMLTKFCPLLNTYLPPVDISEEIPTLL